MEVEQEEFVLLRVNTRLDKVLGPRYEKVLSRVVMISSCEPEKIVIELVTQQNSSVSLMHKIGIVGR